MRPVERDGLVLVDGAAVNPLPFDLLRGKADVVIAVDAAVGPGNAGWCPTRGRRSPPPWR
jgi:NTE family protein